MDAISENGDRPTGSGEGRGELPVLFHLIDVSRKRPAPTVEQPESEIVEMTIADPSPCAVALPTEPSEPAPPAAPPYSQPIAPVFVPEPSPPAAAHAIHHEPPASAPTPAIPGSAICESTLSDVIASATTAGELAPVEHAVVPPADRHPITPRSYAAAARKAKTKASEDWFASHGKFIAIAFVLALVGTVYFARTSRRRETTPSSAAPSAPSIAAAPEVKLEPPAKLLTSSPAATASAPTSASQDSKAELLAPTAPPLVAATSEEKPKSSDNLFVFPSAKSSEERVASRTEAGSGAPKLQSGEQAAAKPSDAATSPVARQAAPSTQPALSPSYPTTSSPSAPYPVSTTTPGYPRTSAPPLVGANPPMPPAGQPTNGYGPMSTPSGVAPPAAGYGSPPPAAGYGAAPQAPPLPSQNYRSQFPTPAAGAAQPSQAWMPPGATPPGPYQPWDNTARGQRYERTGSGNQ